MRILIISGYNNVQKSVQDFFNNISNRKIELLKQKFTEYIMSILSEIECVGLLYIFIVQNNQIEWIPPNNFYQNCFPRNKFLQIY